MLSIKIVYYIWIIGIFNFNYELENSKNLIKTYVKNEKCLLKEKYIKSSCKKMNDSIKKEISIYLLNCNLKTIGKKEICWTKKYCKEEIRANRKLLIYYLKHFYNYCNYLKIMNLESIISNNGILFNAKLNNLNKELNINHKINKKLLDEQNNWNILSNKINLKNLKKLKKFKIYLKKQKKNIYKVQKNTSIFDKSKNLKILILFVLFIEILYYKIIFIFSIVLYLLLMINLNLKLKFVYLDIFTYYIEKNFYYFLYILIYINLFNLIIQFIKFIIGLKRNRYK